MNVKKTLSNLHIAFLMLISASCATPGKVGQYLAHGVIDDRNEKTVGKRLDEISGSVQFLQQLLARGLQDIRHIKGLVASEQREIHKMGTYNSARFAHIEQRLTDLDKHISQMEEKIMSTKKKLKRRLK